MLNWVNNRFPFLFTWGGVFILKFCCFFSKVFIIVTKKDGNIFWKFAWSVGYMWYRLETKFWLYRRTILYSFEIYGLFGTVYGIFGTVYMVYLVQYIWYIWYRLSSTALKYMVYLVQIVQYSFEIYGIFGTVYQYISYIWYIWYSRSISVYLVQIV